MTDIVGTMIQTSRAQNYVPGPCECGKCSGLGTPATCQPQDWQAATLQCCNGLCPDQPVCVPLDKQTCDIGFDQAGLDPVKSVEWQDNNPPNVKCVYDGSRINQDQQLINYVAKMGYNQDLMTQFCLGQTKDQCPTGLSSCSWFNSGSDKGVLCKDWLSTQPKNIQEQILTNYCQRFPDSQDECACINREKNPHYAQVQPILGGDGYCWYKQCLLPSALKPLEPIDPATLEYPSCRQNCDLVGQQVVQLSEAEKDIVGCSLPPIVIQVDKEALSSWPGVLLILGLLLLGLFLLPIKTQFGVTL